MIQGKFDLHYLKEEEKVLLRKPSRIATLLQNKINEDSLREGEEGLPSPVTPPACAERSSKSSLAPTLNRKIKDY
jgi:hypothetical protein